MNAKCRIFPLILLSGLLVSAAPTMAAAQTIAVSRDRQQEAADPKARQVRDQFMKVLQQYPPALGTVLKADPSLVNDQYLAPYPAVLAFVSQHPEVRRSPAFYLEAVQTGDGYYYDYASRSWNNMMEMTAVFVIILTIALSLGWLIRTAVDYRRWGRLTKVQAEAHTKLLDRFTGNEELIAYVKSPAGMKFLQSSPISLDGGPRSMGAPLSRILWSMQAGVVILAAGIGMNIVSQRIDPDHADQVFLFGVILISLGIGFVVSAGMSYLLSKRLGLFPADSRDVRDVTEG